MPAKESTKSKDKRYTPLIIGISVLLPAVVALLFFLPGVDGVSPELRIWLNKLPMFNAIVNGSTAVILIAGVIAIKSGNTLLHQRLMSTALLLSIVFLVSYVSYHLTSESTRYGGEGVIKKVYLAVLLSHILLSIAVVPMVLVTYVRALSARFDKHRRIARITFPIWLYVAITGVLVYLMIQPYYPFNQ
jgi:putative membrane protein